ncbi:MAG: DNA-3-methyladenine glycosylase I [Solirubrobacterales bacterium]|nr:DNA-3-methyladenine glycosylase I [Solirubrobacterales bacterium]
MSPARGPGPGPDGLVTGRDGLRRPAWAAGDPLLRDYYDHEWGLPVSGERAHFERLTLEGFQAGLSWATILRKRDAFREAFAGFDPDRVSRFTDRELDRLMEDEAIVRNRRKIEAARTNARATVELRAEGGLEDLIWSFKPERTPAPVSAAELATESPESRALAAALKQRGYVFVGPTTMHALMEAIGVIDTHLVGSHRRGSSGVWPV